MEKKEFCFIRCNINYVKWIKKNSGFKNSSIIIIIIKKIIIQKFGLIKIRHYKNINLVKIQSNWFYVFRSTLVNSMNFCVKYYKSNREREWEERFYDEIFQLEILIRDSSDSARFIRVFYREFIHSNYLGTKTKSAFQHTETT